MKKLPVLIINSYAGSLTIAARQEGHQIIGSYEDAGYGLEIQSKNFPGLDYLRTVAEWPQRQDLRDALVIAHPPCAAFSQQNITKTARGLDAPKFQQTRTVIDYALRNRCAALAVESVCGALEGAAAAHDELAAKHGYQVFRVLQNAVSFEVPQWRPRFWAFFLPKARGNLRLAPLPGRSGLGHFVPLETIQLPNGAGTENAHDVERWDRQLRMLMKACGPKWAGKLAAGELGYGSIVRPLHRELEVRGKQAPGYFPKSGGFHLDGSLCATAHAWCCSEHADSTTTFLCRVARLVDPMDVAGAVLGDAWWIWAGKDTLDGSSRPFYEEEYKAVMGFPTDYDFSPVRSRLLRTFLSRGVCPPVAQWVLRTLQLTVEGGKSPFKYVRPGDVADLRPTRREVDCALGARLVGA